MWEKERAEGKSLSEGGRLARSARGSAKLAQADRQADLFPSSVNGDPPLGTPQ